ncbi:MAG: hypothetical protein ETSY1_19870 [Candidatus Entotheonella factor]|uniref:TIR domain-containing protein n=1 Tax=Entotheonella factor TaxID=1429438 RepID=W4LJU3_ENTF1|nr:MAG: hypothetical protein ETSY1_19870 [Candidatus Entotheonella factor]
MTESLSTLYTNAKVVLIGDSGVGKSGLRLVLEGKRFVPTDSTHGRFVTDFDSRQIELTSGQTAHCETLLWDLAGQPGYRLIQQLHLKEVSVALVVFDAKSETDPFAGVRHWDRALRQAQRVQGASTMPLKKFLVASRMDRGGITVSREQIERIISDLGFDGYFETSAKEDVGISELADAIRSAIDWEVIPKVSSTALFQDIKKFLLSEKETGRVLAQVDELYRLYLSRNEATEAEFAACIDRLQDRDLIRRLAFGNLILLQPELIDSYASALVNTARQEPQGLGNILEEDALAGRFSVPTGERLKDVNQEKLLLVAMVNDMLQHEIVLREPAENGIYLIFPSQFTRENPALPDPPGKAVAFEFEGPVLNIYTTLAVRLSYSYAFNHRELWKNAITYTYGPQGGTCGMFLTELREGRGRLTLFYGEDASPETRIQFEAFIRAHLQSHALPESVTQRRTIACSTCGTPVSDIVVQRLMERNREGLNCPVCETYIPLALATPSDAYSNIDLLEISRSADAARQREVATAIIKGKRLTMDFDVFLCHNSADKPNVRAIGERLQERGLLPWLDEWELPPGRPWQPALKAQISHIKSVAVFIGQSGRGPWQDIELAAFIREFVDRNCPVIPVLLADAPAIPDLPNFLKHFTWADFRKHEPDPFDQLIWGITGQRAERYWGAPYSASTRGRIKKPEIDPIELLRQEVEQRRQAGDLKAFADSSLTLAKRLAAQHQTIDAANILANAAQTLRQTGVQVALALDNTTKILNDMRSLAHQDPAIWEQLKTLTISDWEQWFQADVLDEAFDTFARCTQGWPVLRWRRLRLKNIKCFEQIDIDCRPDHGQTTGGLILLGNNATGKSTLLQAIALASLGPAKASQVFPELASERFLRKGARHGSIEVEFEFTVDPYSSERERLALHVGLALEAGASDFQPLRDQDMQFGSRNHARHLDRLRQIEQFEWGLVCGYGAFRSIRSDAPMTSPHSGILDRTRSLFDPSEALVSPVALDELLRKGDVRRLTSEREAVGLYIRDHLLEMFKNVIPGLRIEKDEDNNIRLIESATHVTSITDWSDGCNSTASLLGHLIRHSLEITDWELSPILVEGIVLIAEVDLHLHPSWQRYILTQLQAAFPNMQFIVSTHSPLVLGGAPDDMQVCVLRHNEEGQIVADSNLPSAHGLRADQLLTGEFFDLPTSYDRVTEEWLNRYAALVNDPDASETMIAEMETMLDQRKQNVIGSKAIDREAWAALQEFLRDRLHHMDETKRREFLTSLRSHARGTDYR